MIEYRAPICYYCAHKFEYEMRCAAFPSGIPMKIQEGEAIHDHPIKGDHGIIFKVKEGMQDDYKNRNG